MRGTKVSVAVACLASPSARRPGGWKSRTPFRALNSRREPANSAPAGGRDGWGRAVYLRRVMATGVAPVRRCTRAGVPARTRLRRDVCVGRQIRRVTSDDSRLGELRTVRSRSTIDPSAAPVAEKNGRHHPIFVTAHDLRAWQGLSVDSSRRGDGRRGEGRPSRYAGHRGGDDAVVQRRRAGGVGVALGLRILGRRGRGVARRGRRLVPGTRPTRGAPTHARGGLRRARETRPRGLRGRGRGRGAVGRRAIASSSFAANAVPAELASASEAVSPARAGDAAGGAAGERERGSGCSERDVRGGGDERRRRRRIRNNGASATVAGRVRVRRRFRRIAVALPPPGASVARGVHGEDGG